jgi:hypothetical protein
LCKILDQQTLTLAQITTINGRLDSQDWLLARLETKVSLPPLQPALSSISIDSSSTKLQLSSPSPVKMETRAPHQQAEIVMAVVPPTLISQHINRRLVEDEDHITVLETKLSLPLPPPAAPTVDTAPTPMKPTLSSGIKAIDKNKPDKDLKVSPAPPPAALMVSHAEPVVSCTSLQSAAGLPAFVAELATPTVSMAASLVPASPSTKTKLKPPVDTSPAKIQSVLASLGHAPTRAVMAFKVFPWEPKGMTHACIHAGKPTRDHSSGEKKKEINPDILHMDANLFVFGSIQCIAAKIFGNWPTQLHANQGENQGKEEGNILQSLISFRSPSLACKLCLTENDCGLHEASAAGHRVSHWR